MRGRTSEKAGAVVSVLMPVRDGAATLPAALASLRAQTLGPIEVVLVDDGSRDGSGDVARAAWGEAPGLRIVRQEPRGITAALNAGLAACRAPLIARMDADDVALPVRLARQAALLAAHPDVAIAGCLVTCFADAGLGGGYRRYEAWVNSLTEHEAIVRELLIESPLPHPSVMARREALAALGGYREMGWPEDYDLWLRAAARGLRFAKVPEVLLRWRDHPRRLSRTDPRYAPDAFLRCKAHFLARGPLAGAAPIVLWGAGRTGRRLRRHLSREGIEVATLIDIDPRKLGRRIDGAPVLAPDALGPPRGRRLVTAVAAPGARAEIRAHLTAAGWREGPDFICAA